MCFRDVSAGHGSSNLVFKPELVPGGLDPAERGYGVASHLSLFVRGSIPDEELWNLAGKGELAKAEVVEAQARRLLENDLSRFAQHFGGQWLDYRESEDLGPLTASMMQAEAAGVFSEVLATDLPPERLMTPGFTMLDAPLASHYGLPFRQQKLVTSERGGLLSQALFLQRTATGSEFRRPIHRGLWALTRMLCRSLPRLDAATLEEISMSVGMIDRNLTLREQMEIHRNNSARCGGCHKMMDPIGLALEKYDPRGVWRDTYPNGAPVTSDLEFDGVVSGPEGPGGGCLWKCLCQRLGKRILGSHPHRGGAWGVGNATAPGFLAVDEQRGWAYGLDRNKQSGALYRWSLSGGRVEWLNSRATGTRDARQYISDGPVTNLDMANPAGLIIDKDGFLYIGAGDGQTFRRYNHNTQIVESLCAVAGAMSAENLFEWCIGDGSRNRVFQTWPSILTLDGAGNAYFGYTVWPRLVRLTRTR